MKSIEEKAANLGLERGYYLLLMAILEMDEDKQGKDAA